jgi:alkanesulfonate monooxygenase SsuD/methylene tetrahydromethanopterin reductase-like flavin-dependent oxidoreductase (luciferase family)
MTDHSALAIRLREDRLPFGVVADLVRLAEAQGYAGLWVPENKGREVFTQLGALAAMTERIRLGPGIANIFTRTPTVLAQAAVTLDQVSGGRAWLGLGTGHQPTLEEGHGIRFGRPMGRMRDAVRIVRAITRGEALPETPVVGARAFRLETSPPRADLPIFVAALGPQMCELAGELADGVILNWATPAYVRSAVEHVRTGAARAGRDPASVTIACYVRLSAGAPPAVMRRALAREIARYIDMLFYRQMFDAAGFVAHTGAVAAAWPRDPDEAAGLVADEMLAALTVAGDGDAFAQRVAEYRALGVTLPVVAPVPAGDDLADAWAAAITLAAKAGAAGGQRTPSADRAT